MKKLLAIALSCAVLSVNAGIIEDLKREPVSKFELGKMKMSLSAYFGTLKQEGQEIGDTGLTLKKIDVPKGDNLGVVVSFVGRSKKLSQDICNGLNQRFKATFKEDKDFIEEAFTGLTVQQYQELNNVFTVSTELISKENPNLKITCQ